MEITMLSNQNYIKFPEKNKAVSAQFVTSASFCFASTWVF